MVEKPFLIVDATVCWQAKRIVECTTMYCFLMNNHVLLLFVVVNKHLFLLS